MKRFLQILLASTLALAPSSLVLIATAPVVVGCKHSPRVQALETLEVTLMAVHDAMNIYGRAFRAGKLSDLQIASVRKARKEFQAGIQAALVAVEFNISTATPASVLELKTTLISIIGGLPR